MILDKKDSSHSSRSFQKTLGSQDHVVEDEETNDSANTQLVYKKHLSLSDNDNMSPDADTPKEKDVTMSYHKKKEATKKKNKINSSRSTAYSPSKPTSSNNPNGYRVTMNFRPCYSPIKDQQRDFLCDVNLNTNSQYTLQTPNSFLNSPVFYRNNVIKDPNFLYSYPPANRSLFPSEIYRPTLDSEEIVVQRQCLGGLFKWTEYITKYFVHPSPTPRYVEDLPTYYTPLAISYQSYE
jgi:hypothetical protein